MRMNTAAAKGLLTIALCALGGAAQAHVGHEGGHAATFVSGLAHPVSGLDHLLAMVAVGLWSAVALPRRRWQAPAVFVVVMALGALLAHLGAALPLGGALEVMIAASVVLLGIAMKTLPVGTAYAVWVGIGAVGTAVLGIVLLGDAANAGRIVSLALIVAGVVGLKLATPA